MIVRVEPDGRLVLVYADALAPLLREGPHVIRRASNVEPAEGGGWSADLEPVGGPVLGPYALRSEALAAEVAWLEGRLAAGKLSEATEPAALVPVGEGGHTETTEPAAANCSSCGFLIEAGQPGDLCRHCTAEWEDR